MTASSDELPDDEHEAISREADRFVAMWRTSGDDESLLVRSVAEFCALRDAATSSACLRVLLIEILIRARRIGKRLSMDAWSERFAQPGSSMGGAVKAAFYDEALLAYEEALETHDNGDLSPPSPDIFIPELVGGGEMEQWGVRLFGELLNIHKHHRNRKDRDLVVEVWRLLTDRLRESPFVDVFCQRYGLLLPREKLGLYSIVKPIGIGGMAVVYLAEHADHFHVALKTLRPDKTDRKKFDLEAQVTVNVRHSNLVEIKDSNLQHEKGPYFTMDCVEGGKSLADLIENPSRCRKELLGMANKLKLQLPPEWISNHTAAGKDGHATNPSTLVKSSVAARFVATITAEIAEATEYLHYFDSGGYLHCDIKPGNILLSRKNGPQLADLGLCEALDENGNAVQRLPFGTRDYSSPEQLIGQMMTRSSDVYALGATLYHALEGTPPRNPNGQHLISNPAVPNALRKICLKSISDTPSRYSTAAEFGADLRRFLQGRPVKAAPAFRVRSAVYRCLHSPSLWVTLVALILLTTATLGFSNYINQENEDSLNEKRRNTCTIPNVEASKPCYRTTGNVTPPEGTIYTDEVVWPYPKYEYVKIYHSSVLMDLTPWQLVPRHKLDSASVEAAYYTRVIRLQKRHRPTNDNAAFWVTFRFMTGGIDIDLNSPTHPAHVTGSRGKVKTDLIPGLKVRDIAVDISKEDYNKDITIVIQGVIWNGFQPSPTDSTQWAAFQSPDNMGAEIALVFKNGQRPKTFPKLDRKYKDGEREIIEPIDATATNFTADPGESWWRWTVDAAKADSFYRMQFIWPPTNNNP